LKTRFTPLVKIKKSDLDKCERDLSKANEDKKNAQKALDEAYRQLEQTSHIKDGTMSQFLQERAVLDIQRGVIEQKRSWLNFASQQLEQFKQRYNDSAIEYEKYKYLETQEIAKLLKIKAKAEAKQLDESALHSFMFKQERK
jgi:flagellar export protein FliJ